MTADVSQDLSEVWGKMKATIRSAEGVTSVIHAESSAAPTEVSTWMNLLERLSLWITDLNSLKTTPGLADYVRNEQNDPGMDIVVSMQLSIDALTTLAVNIDSSLPVGATGYVEEYKISAQYKREYRSLASASPQAVSYRADINAFLATVVV